MMEKTRTRRDADTWQAIVDRQAQSGAPIAAFCEQEGLSVASFYGWRSKLRKKPDASVKSMTVMKNSRGAEGADAGFIDLGSLGIKGPRCEVRLELGAGIVLQLVRG